MAEHLTNHGPRGRYDVDLGDGPLMKVFVAKDLDDAINVGDICRRFRKGADVRVQYSVSSQAWAVYTTDHGLHDLCVALLKREAYLNQEDIRVI